MEKLATQEKLLYFCVGYLKFSVYPTVGNHCVIDRKQYFFIYLILYLGSLLYLSEQQKKPQWHQTKTEYSMSSMVHSGFTFGYTPSLH